MRTDYRPWMINRGYETQVQSVSSPRLYDPGPQADRVRPADQAGPENALCENTSARAMHRLAAARRPDVLRQSGLVEWLQRRGQSLLVCRLQKLYSLR